MYEETNTLITGLTLLARKAGFSKLRSGSMAVIELLLLQGMATFQLR